MSLVRRFNLVKTLKSSRPFSSKIRLRSSEIVKDSEFSIPQKHPDLQLKRIFDDEAYWSKLVGANFKNEKSDGGILHSFFGRQDVNKQTGLFKNPFLKTPEGLLEFCDFMLGKAEIIVKNLVSDHSEGGLRNYVKNLDTLSDILCKVIDLCEFIRISHPDPEFSKVSQQCHEKMFNYMNLLNTNVDLYLILKTLLHDPKMKHIRTQLSQEELVVGTILLEDFEKSGIDKSDEDRDLFIEISSRISIVGQQFNNNTAEVSCVKISLSTNDLKSSLSASMYNEITITKNDSMCEIRDGNLIFPVNSHVSYILLQNCSNEYIRKLIWTELNSASQKQIRTLELLLNYRKLLALKLNYKDFNDYQLIDKMSKSPKNVLAFLANLKTKIKPLCIEELKKCYALKLKDFQQNPDLIINSNKVYKKLLSMEKSVDALDDNDIINFIKPWDREYLIKKILTNKKRTSLNTFKNMNPPISQFFSLGTIFTNLSEFLKIIYGVKLKFDEPKNGEIWHSDVRKLLLVNKDDETDIIGIIYLDLFERMNKSLNPAHFTIVCSRKVSDDSELENCEILNETETDDAEYENSNNNGNNNNNNNNNNNKYIQCVRNSSGEVFQLPIITLVCNFHKSVQNKDGELMKTAQLRLSEIETLFHEIGHCLHSMFGKTKLHNVSGTRCLTDFVELPSILMETFTKDSRVLSFLSDSPFTENLNDVISVYQSESDVFKYCDIYSQLKMAYLDQQLYLNTPNPKLINGRGNKSIEISQENNNLHLINAENIDMLVSSNLDYSKGIYHKCEKDLEILEDDSGSWYGKFGHLFTYGTTYYTYLFDRAIASKIYKELFSEDPFNAKGGKAFRSEILKWGGSKNPWVCVGSCLKDDRLIKGNEESMKLIGDIEDVK